MEFISFKPIWFDSLGAKSSCMLVETDTSILIDPGAAIMQPSFPASYVKKLFWLEKAGIAIRRANRKAKIIIISHYHYDHFMEDPGFYTGKTLLAKNPNEYINDSQRGRAEAFYERLCRAFRQEIKLGGSEEKAYGNPLDELPLSRSMRFGSYDGRRRALLRKGEEWFAKRARKWGSWRRIPELAAERFKVEFPEGKEFKFGCTRLRFTKPLFHGIEFSRVGWVFATIVERGKEKLIHSSDLNGPIIEDYAEWIIRENPSALILDGPMTYMLGYTLNLINFRRALSNALRIIEETDAELIIYDHHLPREPKFKERTKEVWRLAEKLNKRVLTAAELLGKEPAVLSSSKAGSNRSPVWQPSKSLKRA